LQQSLAVIALLTPGVAALLAGAKMLGETSEQDFPPSLRSPQRAGMSRLAVSSLLYYLLLALVWAITGIDIPDLINKLATSVVSFLTIPLVLLLVAAGESGARVTHPSPLD
jgi:hypothetical protein